MIELGTCVLPKCKENLLPLDILTTTVCRIRTACDMFTNYGEDLLPFKEKNGKQLNASKMQQLFYQRVTWRSLHLWYVHARSTMHTMARNAVECSRNACSSGWTASFSGTIHGSAPPITEQHRAAITL